MAELKPCPFCGGEAKKVIHVANAYISCTQCSATSAAVIISADICAVDKAAELWNRRTNCPDCIKEG